MNARLRNEFIGNNPDAAKKRQQAFDVYNAIVDLDRSRAANFLGKLAAGDITLKREYPEGDTTFPAVIRRVLKESNGGTQIGFVSGDEPWGSVFADEKYTEARRAYTALSETEKSSSEGIALREQRAIQVLRVAVEIVQKEPRKSTSLPNAA